MNKIFMKPNILIRFWHVCYFFPDINDMLSHISFLPYSCLHTNLSDLLVVVCPIVIIFAPMGSFRLEMRTKYKSYNYCFQDEFDLTTRERFVLYKSRPWQLQCLALYQTRPPQDGGRPAQPRGHQPPPQGTVHR